MPKKRPDPLTPAEEHTTRYLHAMIGDIFELMAHQFRGETTLNHLRIGSFIGLRTLYQGRTTNNRDIAETLGLSRPTVSRVVSDFIREGWVVEEPDPDDGRVRFVSIDATLPEADRFERDFRRIINGLLQRYEAGEIVQVDPDKKSFNL